MLARPEVEASHDVCGHDHPAITYYATARRSTNTLAEDQPGPSTSSGRGSLSDSEPWQHQGKPACLCCNRPVRGQGWTAASSPHGRKQTSGGAATGARTPPIGWQLPGQRVPSGSGPSETTVVATGAREPNRRECAARGGRLKNVHKGEMQVATSRRRGNGAGCVCPAASPRGMRRCHDNGRRETC